MKFMNRLHIWDIKREIKFYEGKLKFMKDLLKHFQKEYK